MKILYFHTGKADFPHGAGASEPGYYVYDTMTDDEPVGPLAEAPIFPQRRNEYSHLIIDMPEAK
jgi:hypothetical protein